MASPDCEMIHKLADEAAVAEYWGSSTVKLMELVDPSGLETVSTIS